MLANWITLLRLPFLMGVLWSLYTESQSIRVLGVAALLLGLLLDTVDGIVARWRHETTLVGSVLDIATDRTYEIVLWICFADLGLVPLIIPIAVVVRSALVDGFRSLGVERGTAPFAQVRGGVGRYLVASPWLRSAYGLSKLIAFCGLALVHALAAFPVRFPAAAAILLVHLAVWVCVTLCLVRGLPVVIEGMAPHRLKRGRSVAPVNRMVSRPDGETRLSQP